MTLTTGSRVGHYEVVAKVGEGGMGEVYRATDTRLNRCVALKILPHAVASDGDRVARFRREAQLLAALNHPNVAGIYGLEETPSPEAGRPAVRALVMELVEGATLADRLAQGPIPLDETIAIAQQIAEAIEYAHEQGIIHRDLKPANIKISPSGTVKVLDFGLGKMFARDGPDSGHPGGAPANSPTLSLAATQAGLILGTAAYMSPEQAKGKPVDRRADVWSFGIVLFEMLAGRAAFDGDTVSETMAHVITKEPDWAVLPLKTPVALHDLLRRCLVKDPRNRLQAIGEARIVLTALAASEGAKTSAAQAPVTAAVLAPARGRPHATALWALAAVALLSLCAAAWFAWQAATTTPGVARGLPVHFGVSQPGIRMPTAAVAISRDGSAIAFRAVSGSAGAQIMIRELASAAATPLAGSQDGRLPFWSPDGSEVGFLSGRDLMAVNRRTGLRRTLASGLSTPNEAPVITWADDGSIVASGFSPTLLRLNPSTGTITRLSDTPEVFWASPLPDGKSVLFTTRKADAIVDGIAVAPVDNLEERRRLLDVPSRALYAGGHLLYVRNGTLLAHPFDVARLALVGDPYPIADNVSYFRPNGRAQFSGSADAIAYFVRDPAEDPLVLDRSGAVTSALGTPGTVGMALSPDGARVILTIDDPRTGTGDLYLYDLTRRTSTRVTNDEASESQVRWSPDGGRIVYGSDRQGGPPDLYVHDLSVGSTPRALLSKAGIQYPSAWMKDGRIIVSDATEPNVLLLSVDGKLETMQPPIRRAAGQDVAISPDQRWVAFSESDTSGGRAEVYVQPLGRPGPRVRVSINGGVGPRWRADGKELFFRIIRDVMASTVTPGKVPSFSPPRVLFSLDRPVALMDIFPDGQRFLILPAAPAEFAPLRVLVNWRR